MFEQLNLPAQRRLSDAKLFGCAREIALAHDGNEVTKLAEIHGSFPNEASNYQYSENMMRRNIRLFMGD
ncbi:hypothetical protein M3I53_20900 [Paraburkholderia sp. CNPSo 3272]|nr:hypothetical protein [Paraburkholderia sp. CNPSo 3272]